MRIPNSCPSESESDEEEYPETNDRYEDYEDDENRNPSSSYMNFTFRNIRRGSTIDCLDDDGNWYSAEVKKLDKRDRKLYVSFTNAGDIFDKWVVFDHRVARLNTYTYDNNGNFKIGQMIEFSDGAGGWKKGIITAVSAEQNRVQVCSSIDRSSWWVSSPRSNIRALQRQAIPIPRGFRRWKVPSSTGYYHNQAANTGNSPRENAPSNSIAEGSSDPSHTRKIAEFSDRYSHYTQTLETSGLYVVQVNGDGNCLFRAVAHQIYGDEEFHGFVREYCMNYMEADSKFFSQFVEGGEAAFSQYLQAKRSSGCWGDDPEIQALCEIYDRPAEIWAYDNNIGARKLRTFHEAAISTNNNTHDNHSSSTSNSSISQSVTGSTGSPRVSQRPLIKLSYYGGGHYDSLVDETFQSNLVPTGLIGKIENAAISRCGHRLGVDANVNRNTSNSSSAFSDGNVESAKRQTDAEATERATLDMAIQISRHEHLGWANSDDIDACLLMALDMPPSATQQQSSSTTSSSIHTNIQSLQQAQQQQQLSLESLTDATADLVAVQQDLMKTVTEQSERDYIEKAILSSLTTTTSVEDDSKLIEDELIEQARRASIEMLSATATSMSAVANNNNNNAEKGGRSNNANNNSNQQQQQLFDEDAYSKSLEVAEATKWSDWSEEDVIKLTMEKSLQEHTQQQQKLQQQQPIRTQQSNYSKSSPSPTEGTQQSPRRRGSKSPPPQIARNQNVTSNNNNNTSHNDATNDSNNDSIKAKAAVQHVEIDLDEEAMLEAAIRESLLSSSAIRHISNGNSCVGGVNVMADPQNYGTIKNNGNNITTDAAASNGVMSHEYCQIGDEEDKDLSRAIADSLRHLQ